MRKTQVAKGMMSPNPDGDSPKWKTYPANVNEVFDASGLLTTFGSRSKFMYDKKNYYLVETSKYNSKENTLESYIALCDKAMVPLALLPFQLPKEAKDEKAFFAPSVTAFNNKIAVTIQARGIGSSFAGDWNELDGFPETVNSYMYFIDMDGTPKSADEAEDGKSSSDSDSDSETKPDDSE